MPGKTATRERILAVAPELLRRFTLSKFSMEDVARAAGIARQTVYKYFSSRDDLLVTLFVEEMLENHAPKMADVVSLPTSEENLLDIFITELSLARSYALFGEVLTPGVAPRTAELVFRSEKMVAARDHVWIPVLERYRDHGVLRPGLDLAATVRWITYQEYWLLTHPTVLCDDDQVLRTFVRDFVVAALVAPA